MFLLYKVTDEMRVVADTQENRNVLLKSWAVDGVYRVQIDMETLRDGARQDSDALNGSLNLRAHEERLIKDALRRHETQRQAAAALGISHSTLAGKLKKMEAGTGTDDDKESK